MACALASPCLRIRRGVVGVDAGQTLSISRHAPDWRVQCFGVELVAVVLVVLLNLFGVYRYKVSLTTAALPPTHLDGPNCTDYNNIDHLRYLNYVLIHVLFSIHSV